MDLTPGASLSESVNVLVATDTTRIANATAQNVHLAKSPFTPGPNLDPTSITEADFDTYAVKHPTAGNQGAFTDPLTGQQVVVLVEPVGGWQWSTGGTGNLPQTIYGVYYTADDDATLWGAALLSAPIVLTAPGQVINLGQLRFSLPLNPLGPS